jgi:hypothetical protein
MNSAVAFSSSYRHPRGLNRIVLVVGLGLVSWSRRSRKPEPNRNELLERHHVQLARDAALDAREAALSRQLYSVIR